MTEKEALEKLEFFKDSIISLKGRISELEKEVEKYKDIARKVENELELCKSEAEGLNHENKRLQDDISYLEKTIAEVKESDPSNEFAEYKARMEKKFQEEQEGFERKLDIYIAEKNKEQEKNKELEEDIKLLEKVISELKDGANEQDNYKKEIKTLKENNEALLKRYKEREDELLKLREEADKCDNALEGLRVKAYHTIKHLVEDVIEPDKARIAEKEKRIANLEMTLMMKSSTENVMIVKSAERELKEMIDQS